MQELLQDLVCLLDKSILRNSQFWLLKMALMMMVSSVNRTLWSSSLGNCLGEDPKLTLAKNELIFTGGEDRVITTWDMGSGKDAYNIDAAHKSRVKGIVVLSKEENSGTTKNPYMVASSSSDKVIRVRDVRLTNKEKLVPFSEANTLSRLTCLAGSSIKYCKPTQ